MTIYSIIPLEIIYENYENNIEKKSIEIEYLGEKLEVSHIDNNQYVINRLISTSPKAFLNSRLNPGTIISGIDFMA